MPELICHQFTLEAAQLVTSAGGKGPSTPDRESHTEQAATSTSAHSRGSAPDIAALPRTQSGSCHPNPPTVHLFEVMVSALSVVMTLKAGGPQL